MAGPATQSGADHEDQDKGGTQEGTPQEPFLSVKTEDGKREAFRFESQEDAVRTFREKERLLGEKSTEIQKLRAEQEQMRTEVLGKLAAAQERATQAAATAGSQEARETWEERVSKLGKLLDGEEDERDPQKFVAGMGEVMSGWIAEEARTGQKKTADQFAQLTAKLDAVTERLETLSPDYQQNQEMIAEVRKDIGVDITTAKKIVGFVKSRMPEDHAGGGAPPIAIDTARRGEAEPAAKTITEADKNDLNAFVAPRGGPISADEHKALTKGGKK